jgi:hypothetical protein
MRLPTPLLQVALASLLCGVAAADDQRPFAIQVVDEATGRGVPLVELTTTNSLQFFTDSAGWVAVSEPGLMGREVFFLVKSHGYEHAADGFGYRGKRLKVEPGGEATIKLKRINIAERLYRVTGEGIYCESVKLGKEVPLEEPLMAGGVVGQDSNQAAAVGDRIYWFWGDTSQIKYPLGNFGTSGAWSVRPEGGGLQPSDGVNLNYFVNDEGFSRPMFQLKEKGLVWLDGVFVIDNPEGKPTIVGHYSRREGLAKQLGHGIASFNPEQGKFTPLVELPEEAPLFPQGHAFHVKEENGPGYVYFGNPYPQVRVKATWESVLNPGQYEALTPLAAGSTPKSEIIELQRDAEGNAACSWTRGAATISADDEHRLIEAGRLQKQTARWQTEDAETGKRVSLHGGSVRWNPFRKKWVMIATQLYGKASLLGEIWYAEAERPEGPWRKAIRIVTHDQYSFYNPVHHEFFDEEGGRRIYFEGTYTKEFSGAPQATPRYNYNQIMYRLDLADPRIVEAFGESSGQLSAVSDQH